MPYNPKIFKAYDIRGIYPDQIDEKVAYKLGQGYAEYLKPKKPIIVGYDVRIHSESLKNEVIKGLVDAGVDVIDVGLISTDMYYFAVGNYKYGGGIQVTASHNPPEWHGAKMVREECIPLSGDVGLSEIKQFVESGEKINAKQKGSVIRKDILDDFCRYNLSWIKSEKIKPQKVVYNPNFGIEGRVFERIIKLGNLPIKAIPLNAEPDGTFPKGRPDPFIPENRGEISELVRKEKADFGVAWDADGDRVFFCADGGVFLESYYTGVLLIKENLKKYPKAKIIYDVRNTWALIDATKESGGIPLEERVGHSFIKARMRKEDAVFCAEASAHAYYRDYWYADSGIIPLMQILKILSETGKKLSELTLPLIKKYPILGEVNFTTEKAEEIMEKAKKIYSDAKISCIDGVSIEYSDWRFNLRSSNTEPLLRLNLEAKSKELVEEKVRELKVQLSL
ncbi:MAG: phosphomannomutase/phosphoglucomutase [Candidatus Berkelbacteria bacterium]|nr:phosphomannomutase/phosphoglucomutase [Candidatus Berkelbacteria bacterium]